MRWLLTLAIRAYQWVVSPFFHLIAGPGTGCRFHPTCSTYAIEVIRHQGAWRGLGLAARRLSRCHPFAKTEEVV